MSTLCTDLSHIGHLARREYALGDTKLAMLTDDGALALAPSAPNPRVWVPRLQMGSSNSGLCAYLRRALASSDLETKISFSTCFIPRRSYPLGPIVVFVAPSSLLVSSGVKPTARRIRAARG